MSVYFSGEFSTNQKQQIQSLFEGIDSLGLSKNLWLLNVIKKIELIDHVLKIEVCLPFLWEFGLRELQQTLSEKLQYIAQAKNVEWKCHYSIATLKRANQQPAVKGVKNILAVSSGKGGVGKSTIAVNLALALQKLGANVGILDADIYGPSIPHMLGVAGLKPISPDNKHIEPINVHGILANSIGFLMEPDSATIWRGPMASSALTQLLQETLWAGNGKELDYLVIDMPPGTGDIQLTLSQQIPVTGAIVVTTPQDIALLDAVKGVAMFQRVNVPVLGIVENMSIHICSKCGHHENLFGVGGAAKIADKYHVALLSQLPLHIQLREDMDSGNPTVISTHHQEIAEAFLKLAEKISIELYRQGSVIPGEILFKAID